jgi:hypothetical protein
MTLSAEEFIRRFLLHVLPHGFHRIRHFGFLGNRYRQEKLARCRQLLGMPIPEVPSEPSAAPDYRDRYESAQTNRPARSQGEMIEELLDIARWQARTTESIYEMGLTERSNRPH